MLNFVFHPTVQWTPRQIDGWQCFSATLWPSYLYQRAGGPKSGFLPTGPTPTYHLCIIFHPHPLTNHLPIWPPSEICQRLTIVVTPAPPIACYLDNCLHSPSHHPYGRHFLSTNHVPPHHSPPPYHLPTPCNMFVSWSVKTIFFPIQNSNFKHGLQKTKNKFSKIEKVFFYNILIYKNLSLFSNRYYGCGYSDEALRHIFLYFPIFIWCFKMRFLSKWKWNVKNWKRFLLLKS